MIRKQLIYLYTAILFLMSVTAMAAVEREVSFDSTPTGANVYIISTKRTFVGTTPFKTNVSFYSMNHGMRFVFEKEGYETQALMASVTNLSLHAEMKPDTILEDPKYLPNKKLQDLQHQVNKSINMEKLLLALDPSLLIKKIIVEEKDNTVRLIFKLTHKEITEMKYTPLKDVWEKTVLPLVKDLRKRFALPKGVDELLIMTQYKEKTKSFATNNGPASRLECKGGYQSKYMVTASGGQFVNVWNPCLTKVRVAIDNAPIPITSTIRITEKFAVSADQYKRQEFSFDKIQKSSWSQ